MGNVDPVMSIPGRKYLNRYLVFVAWGNGAMGHVGIGHGKVDIYVYVIFLNSLHSLKSVFSSLKVDHKNFNP